jgi:hypothetical protein
MLYYIFAPRSFEFNVITTPPSQKIMNTSTNKFDLSELPIPSELY